MAEKKTAKKENSQVDLEEILGDIKTVVSGEKETLFKVSDYKTIKLKKENLINSGKKSHSSAVANHNNKGLEELVTAGGAAAVVSEAQPAPMDVVDVA